jgi:phosphoglycerol transferase MdoB-like AlkP superfamily enzyme
VRGKSISASVLFSLEKERKTILIATQTRDDTKHQGITRVGKLLLFADASFLLVIGGIQMLFELLGHFFGIGPLATAFVNSPYTIGFFEAHGMAVLAAILLFRGISLEKRRFWHLYAALVHCLLGSANLLFWASFIHFGFIPAGIIATAVHGFFVMTQGSCFVLRSQEIRS